MPAYSLCCLGAVNLLTFVKNPFTNDAYFDLEELTKTIKVSVRFLDNVLDATSYPLKKIEEFSKQWRRIGLGITGLGDMLAMLRIPYGSKASLEVCELIAKTMMENAYLSSIELAKEKGAFPACDKEKLLEANFIKNLPKSLKDGITKYGLRNIAMLTIAPTGTTSLSFGNNCSSGIEPIFSLEYERRIRVFSDKEKDSFRTEKVMDYAWMKYLEIKGKELEESSFPDFFVTTSELKGKEAIDVQSVWQRYIDHSISKCVSLDTLIETEEGLKYLREFSELREEDSYDSTTDIVKNRNGEWERSSDFYFNGIKDAIIITLENGIQVICTPEHRFIEEENWIFAKDLSEGKVLTTL